MELLPSVGRNLASGIDVHESLRLPTSFSESRFPKEVLLRVCHLRLPSLPKYDVLLVRVYWFLSSNGPCLCWSHVTCHGPSPSQVPRANPDFYCVRLCTSLWGLLPDPAFVLRPSPTLLPGSCKELSACPSLDAGTPPQPVSSMPVPFQESRFLLLKFSGCHPA